MKGHWLPVNLWEALHKINMWPVSFHFPNANEKSVLQSLNEILWNDRSVICLCLYRKYTGNSFLWVCHNVLQWKGSECLSCFSVTMQYFVGTTGGDHLVFPGVLVCGCLQRSLFYNNVLLYRYHSWWPPCHPRSVRIWLPPEIILSSSWKSEYGFNIEGKFNK